MAHYRKYPAPKIGDQYGKWTVLEVPDGAVSRTKILCQCSCTRTAKIRSAALTQGQSRGCRICHMRKITRLPRRTLYNFIPKSRRASVQGKIRDILHRCHSSHNASYPNYGGRGISVFPAWRKDRVAFARYLVSLPGWDNPALEIDRIDNDGNYEPGNLRFVTRSENIRNRKRRRNQWITYGR